MGKSVKVFGILSVALFLFALLLPPPAQAQYNTGPGFKISWALNPRTDSNFRPVEYFGSSKVEVGMDFDRDGRREILFATDETLSPAGPDPGFLDIYLYEATGNDQYTHVWHYTMPEGTNSFPAVTYGDIDSDNKWEIYFGVPTINNPNKLFIFEQDDAGAFPANPTFAYDFGKDPALDFRPSGLKLDDVDGDGKIEILAQSRTGSRRELAVVEMTSPTFDDFASFEVEFSAGEDLLGGGGPYDIDVVDFDGDGKKEIWYNTWDLFSFTIFEATGPDTYELQVDLNTLFPNAVDPGSFNRHKLLFTNVDADPALEAWFPMTDGVLYFLDNVSDVATLTADNFKHVGTFDPNGSAAASARGGDLGDIDRDGRSDIIIAGSTREQIYRVEYLGIGSPADSSSYEWTTILESVGDPADYYYPLRIAPVDLDGDGLREVVITNRYADDPSQPLILILEYDPTTADKLADGWEFKNAIAHSDVDSLYKSDNTGNSRTVIGGFDLDNDGKKEIILTDYGAIGVRLFEYAGADQFELVWSSPPDTLAGRNRRKGSNPRVATVGDLDQDNKWEILFPLASDPSGWYVYEWDGITGSDNFGTIYSSIINTEIDSCCAANYTVYRGDHEGIPFILDIDNDGKTELILATTRAATGGKRGLQIITVEGDIEHNAGSGGFETWRTELMVDRGNYGGGTPSHSIPADLDGDGSWEIVNHTFNSHNFFNVDVLGPDSYAIPDPASPTRFYHATALDDVALFGGDVGDVDGDGNDELYFPAFFAGEMYVVDYSPGDDILSVDGTHVVKVFPNYPTSGASIFDVDKNGKPNIITGGGFPRSLVSAEVYGNPRDPSAYQTQIIYTGEPDIFTGSESNLIDIVVKDSLGVVTTTQAVSNRFVSKVQAHFRKQAIDFDNDGNNEIIASFQSNQANVTTLNLTWNAAAGKYDSVQTSIPNAKSWSMMRFEFTGGTGVEEREVAFVTPDDYVLDQNYPNPFNPTTTIRYSLPLDKRVSLRIYNSLGQLVRTLVDNELQASGRHETKWDGRNQRGERAASGVYLYALEFGNFKKTRSMTLLK